MAEQAANMSIANNVHHTSEYKNDILHYLHINLGRSSNANLITACKDHFSSTAILKAKHYLFSDCKALLADIDNELVSSFTKRRI